MPAISFKTRLLAIIFASLAAIEVARRFDSVAILLIWAFVVFLIASAPEKVQVALPSARLVK